MDNQNPNRKVKNPKTKRMIKVGYSTFNKFVATEYDYFPDENELR